MGRFSKKMKRKAFKGISIYDRRHEPVEYMGESTTVGKAYKMYVKNSNNKSNLQKKQLARQK